MMSHLFSSGVSLPFCFFVMMSHCASIAIRSLLWCVISGRNNRISYTFGGRPRAALDLPRYKNPTRLEHSITVSTVGDMFYWEFVDVRRASPHPLRAFTIRHLVAFSWTLTTLEPTKSPQCRTLLRYASILSTRYIHLYDSRDPPRPRADSVAWRRPLDASHAATGRHFSEVCVP